MMSTVMPTREELRDLARLRLREAEKLFEAELYDGCVYLCGYVVEFALKACICATLSISAYPDSRPFLTHDFEELKLLAGLRSRSHWRAGCFWTTGRLQQTGSRNGGTSAKAPMDAPMRENGLTLSKPIRTAS